MSNLLLAENILQEAYARGVRDFIICAGARNSPFVFLLDKAKANGKINVYSFFEERSAAFFALGRIERDHRPVAVITTSGTAAAELLPAAIEATYTAKPLLLITADRPVRYRGTGAPQAIEQVGIFSFYVEKVLDFEGTCGKAIFAEWSRRAPLHVNVCFEEPLIDGDVKEIQFTENTDLKICNDRNSASVHDLKLDRPLVILSALPQAQHFFVMKKLVELSERAEFLIYAEATSGLRGQLFKNEKLRKKIIFGGDRSVQKIVASGTDIQSVIRIGGVPTLRFWRDLEEKYSNIPVASISDTKFSGLSRSCTHRVGFENLESLLDTVTANATAIKHEDVDTAEFKKLNSACEKNPKSEAGLIRKLSNLIGEHSVYLGNSLPIREWDLVSSYELSPARIFANRGANGIDGQISTFLGWASDANKSEENWAIIGDLTALYDLTSLWATKFLDKAICRVVILNNGGGKIFKNMFKHEAFLNQHEVHFEKWAEMWGWEYFQWSDIPDKEACARLSQKCIIEINPDENQSEKFWQELQSK